MESRKRTSLLAELQANQRARIRGGRRTPAPVPHLAGDEALLAQAERTVRRRIWLGRTLPLNLLFLLPGLPLIETRSRVVLVLLIATYPALFALRAFLARLLSALIGPEEILVRREFERLQGRPEKT